MRIIRFTKLYPGMKLYLRINNSYKLTNVRDKSNINDGGVNMSTNTLQRPCTILESVEESFKQIGEFKQNKRDFKSLDESKKLWDKWIEEVESENDKADRNI